MLIHFGISQMLACSFLGLITLAGLDRSYYISHVIELTGVSALLTTLVLTPFCRRDIICQKASGRPVFRSFFPSLPEAALLLLMGAGLAQYLNLLVSLLFPLLPDSRYLESMSAIMEGKALISMIFWMGIVAPVGEEMIFRLLIFQRMKEYMKLPAAVLLSSILFGIYHLDILQGIYAAGMGIFFAVLLEYSGSLTSSMLLHIGGNTWGLLLNLILPLAAASPRYRILFSMISVLLLAMIFYGMACFRQRRNRL